MNKANLFKVRGMIRVDGAYLYDVAEKIHAIEALDEQDMIRMSFFMATYEARQEIEGFIFGSVFTPSFKAVAPPARALIAEIDDLIPEGDETDWNEIIPAWRVTSVKSAFRSFETVLRAELQSSALYHVSPKGGYDIYSLIDNGAVVFPTDLGVKAPGALQDIKAACRCIAFELPTAAAFHLLRANEAVLRVYWDNVTGNADHPAQTNMGVYLAELNKLDKGKKEVREHLKSIKDFHRNPIMHPDQSIDTVDQAIDLLAAIRSSIGYMLREIA